MPVGITYIYLPMDNTRMNAPSVYIYELGLFHESQSEAVPRLSTLLRFHSEVRQGKTRRNETPLFLDLDSHCSHLTVHLSFTMAMHDTSPLPSFHENQVPRHNVHSVQP